MPRILRILNRLNLGGPTYNAAYLTKYLAERYETLLVAGNPEGHESASDSVLEGLSIRAHRVPNLGRAIRPGADIQAYFSLRKLIRDFRPDIVHTHASKAGALGRLAAKSMGVPIILHTFHGHWFHSYFSPLKTRILLEVERRLSTLSTAIVAISPSQAKDLTESYGVVPPHKIRVIPLGIDVSRFQNNQDTLRGEFRHRFHIPGDHVLLAHVGRLVPIKNQKLLLRVFAGILAETSTPLSMCLVGDGPEREALMATARELCIPFRTGQQTGSEPLVFTSWIHDVECVHAASDIGILTSHNEGTPLSLIEAQAAARPVLSTDVGGIRDCLIANETGFLSPAGNAEAMIAQALRLVEDPDLRHVMGERGRTMATQQFRYQRLVADMTSLYEELWEARASTTQ